MGSNIKVSLLILILFSIAQLNIKAQAALNVLTINPSPRTNALGMAGSSLPTDDPYGFYYNPAQLGYFSQTNNLSYQLYPSNVYWDGFSDITYRNTAVDIGYNFKHQLNGLSLSAGLGYIHSKMDYGFINYTTANNNEVTGYTLHTLHPFISYDAYSLGIGIDYYVQLNLGLTYKSIESAIIFSDPSSQNIDIKPSAIDYGFLLTVPVTKLIYPGYKFNLLEDIEASPYLNISAGYSRLNQGGEVWYSDPSQKEPLPRTAMLGYALSAGLNININDNAFKLIEYDFTADAEELLVSNEIFPPYYSYKSGLGNISIGRNLIGLKNSDNVVVHKAHEFNLCETFTVMIGRFGKGGSYNDESNGIGLRLKGILILLKAYTSGETFNFIADHFDVQYYSSKVNYGAYVGENKFESINLSFYNFEF